MNAKVNTMNQSAGTILVRTNRVTIRPERLVCIKKEESGIHVSDRPYTWFERAMLHVMGTLRAQRLI